MIEKNKIDGELKEIFLELPDIGHSIFQVEFKDFMIIYDSKSNNILFKINKNLRNFCMTKGTNKFTGAHLDIIDYETLLSCNTLMNSFDYAKNRFEEKDFLCESDLLYRDYDTMMYIAYSYFLINYQLDDNFESKKNMPIDIYILLANQKIEKDKKDYEVYIIDKNNNKIAGILKNFFVDYNIFGTYAKIKMCFGASSFSNDNLGVILNTNTFKVNSPEKIKNLKDLGVYMLTDDIKGELSIRGRKVLELSQKPNHCIYKGKASAPSMFGKREINLEEKVIIDIEAAKIIEDIPDDFFILSNNEKEEIIKNPNDFKDTWLLAPYVYGLALNSKLWIEMDIKYVYSIEYSTESFDLLQIPKEYKKIILACINNEIPSFDSIEGKGNGKIFLLHGGPGCGKTMTAESIADYLKKPLYSVTVGELGTKNTEIEEELDMINQIASKWNAVVLLDEVDVFASKRNSNDIERNALTAVFLRFLEKYNGVMFMTTNLIDNIDKAFLSRTFKFEYDALDGLAFLKIWNDILEKVKSEGITVTPEVYKKIGKEYIHLSSKMNGRELKNLNRLCFALAKENSNTLDEMILNQTLKIFI